MKTGLQTSLLVRHPETNELFVNFDAQVIVLIREVECMTRLGLEIPPFASSLRARQEEYKNICNALEVNILSTFN